MSDPLEQWPAFVERVRARLEAGREPYGDRSFERPMSELVGEIEQELLDVCGWAFIAFERMERLKLGSKTGTAEAPAQSTDDIPDAHPNTTPKLLLQLTPHDVWMLQDCCRRTRMAPGEVFRMGLAMLHAELARKQLVLEPPKRSRKKKAPPQLTPKGWNDGGSVVLPKRRRDGEADGRRGGPGV